MLKSLREAVFAGSFYPASSGEIFAKLDLIMSKLSPLKKEKVIAVISPHAGWAYSGAVAAKVFASIEVPGDVILIGPNHRGIGDTAAIDSSKSWSFPFGDIPVNGKIAKEIAKRCLSVSFDSRAHSKEHSLEVIIPFLYARNKSVRIIPISLFTEDETIVAELGLATARVAKEFGALIVASSDMTHFLSDGAAREMDGETIEIIKSLRPLEVLRKAKSDSALCGGAPVAVMLTACKELGVKSAQLVGYSNSGDVTGDRSRVVGYCGFWFV